MNDEFIFKLVADGSHCAVDKLREEADSVSLFQLSHKIKNIPSKTAEEKFSYLQSILEEIEKTSGEASIKEQNHVLKSIANFWNRLTKKREIIGIGVCTGLIYIEEYKKKYILRYNSTKADSPIDIVLAPGIEFSSESEATIYFWENKKELIGDDRLVERIL